MKDAVLDETTVKEGMDIAKLRLIPSLSALDDKALKLARTCLVMTCKGVSLSAIPDSHLKMVIDHVARDNTGSAAVDVDATFSRKGTYFLHWNKRTGEWSPGIKTPPIASDGRAGGWIFFEAHAGSQVEAKALTERYVSTKGASFKGGIVALSENEAIVTIDGKSITY
ncbi:MAG: hypothetical protein IPG23_13535 [Burkholderiales bacterium]|jgi:hypothetical protein|nr:hypothetical protein [Burkholderiales bacterium]MBP6646322.1 hypothetical protein [Burkholderiaceae bacterium]